MPTVESYVPGAPGGCDVAIVGGGFSGLMSLAHLARCRAGRRYVVFDRRPLPAPGIAYGACDSRHLLNVPAGRMGAFAEQPGGFHDWLERHAPGRHGVDDFAPRALFGRYLSETVRGVLAEVGARVSFVRDSVVHVAPLAESFELLLASGGIVAARGLVLAPGLPPARAPWQETHELSSRALLAPDPWAASAAEGLVLGGDAVLVGSGLTAVDLVTSLRLRGWDGRIVLVSRGGRLPLPHPPSPESPVEYDLDELRAGAHAAFRAVRRAARALSNEGRAWQAAIDGLRPHAQSIWSSWPAEERQVFLRRLRPLWDIHRHRAPAHLIEGLEQERARGAVEVIRGTVHALRLDVTGRHAEVVVRTSGDTPRRLRASRLFNCSGPATSILQTIDPLLCAMLRDGFASTDRLGLGLRADEDGRLLGVDGSVRPRVRLVGALRRGELWESTAVPELRAQAAVAAQSLSRELDAEATIEP
jgi:uncharacterized NAD(P)/FAD-binding protein YdhS